METGFQVSFSFFLSSCLSGRRWVSSQWEGYVFSDPQSFHSQNSLGAWPGPQVWVLSIRCPQSLPGQLRLFPFVPIPFPPLPCTARRGTESGLQLCPSSTTSLSSRCCYLQRRQWHPTPVLLPGKPHGRRSLVGCSPTSRTQLNDFTFTFHFHALEKEMATHSNILAWRIPGTGEPGGVPSMGLHRVGHDWSDLAAAAAAAVTWLLTYDQETIITEKNQNRKSPQVCL